jgi:nucleotide-binding universal stress UspA family protein
MPSGDFSHALNLEKVLIATDRSVFSEGAFGAALQLAKAYCSELYVVTVLAKSPEQKGVAADVPQQEEVKATRYLKSLKARATAEKLRCHIFLHRGDDPAGLIVAEAASKQVDMIIVGRRGRKGITKFLLGSVAAKIIGRAPCKVLVVPRMARIGYKNILIATDGSSYSHTAAEQAVAIAGRWKGHLIAISVITPAEEPQEEMKNVSYVAELASKADVTIEARTPIGRPHELIAEIAGDRGVDLIVMGTYGRTGLRKFLLGSTTEKVLVVK